MTWRSEQVLGDRYQLIRLLASPDRWLAIDLAADRGLVTLRPVASERLPMARERVDGIRDLLHPALARKLELFESDGEALLLDRSGASERFVPGGVEQLLRAATRCAEALTLAHSSNVVHGNLGPQAVYKDSHSQPLLADFAIQPRNVNVDALGFAQLLSGWLNVVDASAIAAPLELLLQQLKSDQPPTMPSVRDYLDDVYLRWKRNGQVNEAPTLDTVAGVTSRPDESLLPPPVTHSSQWRVVVAAAVTALVVLGVVLFRLPNSVPAPVATVAPVVPEEPIAEVSEPLPPPPTEEELEQLLSDREATQAVIDEVINLQLDLRERNVDVWGTEPWLRSAQLIEAGQDQFRQQQFTDARQTYTEARDLLADLKAQIPAVLEEKIVAGNGALDAWQREAAAALFAQALAIEPENEAAQLGASRATTLDQARALYKTARQQRRDEQLIPAKATYEKLIALDPLVAGSQEALAQINQILADEEFRLVVSEALAALNATRYAEARSGFNQAERMRPGTAVVSDGLQELDRREREGRFVDLRQIGERALADERWADAFEHFNTALERDPTLAFAQQGRQYAAVRARLERQLSAFLNDPGSWLTNRGRDDVAATLTQVERLANPGRRISQQADELSRQLSLANEPVSVQFVSDNACDVLVYRVARLGQFESQQLTLLPGKYVAVGARSGYRDVREEFLVPPGRQPDPIVLRCDQEV